MVDRTPLTTLLSWTWIAHTMEVDNAFEAASRERVPRQVRISLPMWTNGLRQIDESGVTVDQLHARAHARCNLGGLERWGWISVGRPGAGRRDGFGSHRGLTGDTLLRPTRAGTYARKAWPKVLESIESRWRARYGADVIDSLRDQLLAHPGCLPAMPWSPPEVNPSDGFRTHVVESVGGAGPRPLIALLGQVLTRASLELERGADVSLPLGANVLRVMGTASVRLRDLPRKGAISKEAVAMAAGYLHRTGLATLADRTIRLTPVGLAALDDHHQLHGRFDDPGLREALVAVLTQTPALIEGLTPPAGCWRAQGRYLAQTKRLLADPVAALPWHPMVLHRAGWPDGS